MRLSTSVTKHFNHPSTLIVFGSFPTVGHIHDYNQDALASFTKNRITGIAPHTDKIIIITHTTDKPSIEHTNNQLIIRLFRKNQPLSYYQTYQIIRRFPLVKHLLIQYEFATFGDTHMTLLFPIFLFALKLLSKHITIELHQVLTNLQDLAGHLGRDPKSFLIGSLNIFLQLFYRVLGFLADNFIVLEAHLAHRLAQIVPRHKVNFVPHGVEQVRPQFNHLQARTTLGFQPHDFVVLSFGYLTWYKGSDIFVRAAQKIGSNPHIKFCLAGGPSHNQKHKRHYKQWFSRLIKLIDQTPNLRYTDFLSEQEIELYYQAADLIILPYRTFMSSSGPLSLAFSYHKPFLISKPLHTYLDSPDFNEAIQTHGLTPRDLLVSLSPTILAQQILELSTYHHILNKLSLVASSLSHQRSYLRLGQAYKNIISQKHQYTNISPTLG